MGNLKKSLLIVGSEKFTLIALQFISNIILARLLSPNDYGVISMVAIFISLSSLLVDSGFGGSLIYKKNISRADYDTVFWFNILVSVILYAILWFISDYVADFYETPIVAKIIKVMGIIIIFNSLGLIQYSKLNKELKFKYLAISSIASYIISIITSVVLALYGFGVWALVAQQVFNSVVLTVMYICYNRYIPSCNISLKILGEHWNWGKGLFGSSIIKVIYDNIYLQITGKYFSLFNAGLYNQANKIKEVPSQLFCKTFETTIFPILSKEEDNCFNVKIRTISKLFSYISILLLFSLSISSYPIVKLLLGNKWIDAYWILSVLSIGSIFYILESINRSALKAKGKTTIIFNIELVKRIINLIIMVCAILLFGFKGLVYSFTINCLWGWGINCHYLAKYTDYGLGEQIWDCLKYFLPSLMILFLYSYYNVTTSFYIGILGCIFYCITYILTSIFTHDNNLYYVIKILIRK